jgi:hypothetical protein
VAWECCELLGERDEILRSAGVHVIGYLYRTYAAEVERYILEAIRRPLIPGKEIVLDTAVQECIFRLEVLSSSPSQTLTCAVISPLSTQLFLLNTYTSPPSPQTRLHAQTTDILRRYLTSTSSAVATVLSLAQIIRTGQSWSFVPGSTGSISLSPISSPAPDFDTLQTRIQCLVHLIGICPAETKSGVFVSIIRTWLEGGDDPLR